MGNLVIVESPTKARKIQDYLGSDYIVKSSQGHIRDLSESKLSIDIKDGFKPEYAIPAGKQKLVEELKKIAKKADSVLLASDEDREGEAIAWHLSEVLGLSPSTTKRIVFHEITKPAILEAIKNPRTIDMNVVSAQQARRVLDRLVGFELSPVLWKRIQPRLSAGRVQSVALRLVVDREREVENFHPVPYYKVDAVFIPGNSGTELKASLASRLTSKEEALSFLQRCTGASYTVGKVCAKDGVRTPAAPFTTSSLQQEAYRKLGMGVSRTMQIAQKLYEEGFITYMRTDSVNLSSLAIGSAKKFICDNFGEEYSHPRKYKTNDTSAQEAHEAIRPTYIQNADINGSADEKRLYQLIWKRTVASQMADAKVLNTTIEINSNRVEEKFMSETVQILFDGFLKLYIEGQDEENVKEEISAIAPQLTEGASLKDKSISASCKFTTAPPRYNQASLIQKLKDLGIGRPSTYSSIIGTLIKERGYIIEGDKEGQTVTVTNFKLSGGKITEKEKSEKINADKRKLLPQDIGIMVSDYLVLHFPNIMDYQFTADVEREFDEIADGRMQWNKMISAFYSPFHTQISDTLADTQYSRLEREIGIDPNDGKMIVAKYGQYGPYVQKGEGEDKIYASLSRGQIIESLTLEEALKLFQWPRRVGELDGVEIILAKGRFGPYIKYGDRNISLAKNKDYSSLSEEDAIGIIRDADTKPAAKVIAEWNDIQLIDGAYGPYLKSNGSNYKIDKSVDTATLTEEQARQIIATSTPTSRRGRFQKKK